MPELPDVEGFRRNLARWAKGRRVERVEVVDPGVLRNTTPQGLGRALKGRRFGDPRRRGKWLLAPVDGRVVLLHFGMTGELVRDGGDFRHPHDRVIFRLEDGDLRYRDMRKLRGLWLARDDDEANRQLAALGPDALGLSRAELGACLDGRRGGLKAALMDQKVVAGLGNLLTDEILWRARLHPARRAGDLSREELGRLHRAMAGVLQQSVKEGRVPPRPSWLTGARDADPPCCPRCHAELRRQRVGGRSAYWCPRCQQA